MAATRGYRDSDSLDNIFFKDHQPESSILSKSYPPHLDIPIPSKLSPTQLDTTIPSKSRPQLDIFPVQADYQTHQTDGGADLAYDHPHPTDAPSQHNGNKDRLGIGTQRPLTDCNNPCLGRVLNPALGACCNQTSAPWHSLSCVKHDPPPTGSGQIPKAVQDRAPGRSSPSQAGREALSLANTETWSSFIDISPSECPRHG